MIDNQSEATFIIVNGPIDGVLSTTTRHILGQLRRSQKALHPEWIDECVRQGAIVMFDQYIVNNLSTTSPYGKTSNTIALPNVDTPTSRAKRKQSPTEPCQSSNFASEGRSSYGNVPSAPGAIPRAIDPRVRPRLSVETSAPAPSLSGPARTGSPSPTRT